MTSHSSASRWPAALVLVALSVLVGGLVNAYMWGSYLPSFNTAHTPLEGVPHARSSLPSGPPLTRRLVVVIVDGVGFDQVDRIEALRPLRERGVFRGTAVEFPSFTSPALTSFVTGTVPRDSGVRLNGASVGALGLDAVTRVADDAGVPVRVFSRGWKPFESLVRASDADDVHLGGISYALETLRERVDRDPRVEPPPRELRFVYVGETDTALHEHGPASKEFRAAVEVAGVVVARTVAALDLERDTIVVLSDHGHRSERGHGGVEPEVMRAFFLAAGPSVRRGIVLADRPLRDVASTIAVLTGLPTPSSNLGRPMLDALELGDEQRAVTFAAPFDQKIRYLCALAPAAECARAPALSVRLGAGDPLAWREAEILSDELFLDRAAALDASTGAARTRRLAVAAVLALALLTGLFAARRVDPEPRAWLIALPILHLAIYAAVFALLGYRPTFSTIPPMSIFLRDSFLTAAASSAAVVIVAVWRRAGPFAPWVSLAGTTLPFLFLASWVGSDPRSLPPPVAGVLVFYAAPAVLFGAIGAAAIAIAVSRRSPETGSRRRSRARWQPSAG